VVVEDYFTSCFLFQIAALTGLLGDTSPLTTLVCSHVCACLAPRASMPKSNLSHPTKLPEGHVVFEVNMLEEAVKVKLCVIG